MFAVRDRITAAQCTGIFFVCRRKWPCGKLHFVQQKYYICLNGSVLGVPSLSLSVWLSFVALPLHIGAQSEKRHFQRRVAIHGTVDDAVTLMGNCFQFFVVVFFFSCHFQFAVLLCNSSAHAERNERRQSSLFQTTNNQCTCYIQVNCTDAMQR